MLRGSPAREALTEMPALVLRSRLLAAVGAAAGLSTTSSECSSRCNKSATCAWNAGEHIAACFDDQGGSSDAWRAALQKLQLPATAPSALPDKFSYSVTTVSTTWLNRKMCQRVLAFMRSCLQCSQCPSRVPGAQEVQSDPHPDSVQ